MRLALTYTQKNQIILACLPELYYKSEAYYINGYYGFYKYPDKFWGIGGDTPDGAEEVYEPLWFRSYTNVQKRITHGLYIGVRFLFDEQERINARFDIGFGERGNSGIYALVVEAF